MLKLPVIVAPMFLVSTPKMVIESSKSGVIGTFPLLNARPIEQCALWLEEIKDELKDLPWGVNFISHKNSNTRYDDDLTLIEKYEPPIVITSLGHPGDALQIVHEYGGLVYSDVITIEHARRAAQAGVDGLILVCAGAGGHGGTVNPFAFVAAVKEFYSGTIIVAGAISTGADIAAIQLMGADYAYMGTRFIVADESSATAAYKKMVIDAKLDDILYTNAFSGVHANVLIPSIEKEGLDPSTLKPKEKLDLSHMVDVKAWRDIWSAGQGVTQVRKEESIQIIIERLVLEYNASIEQLEKIKK